MYEDVPQHLKKYFEGHPENFEVPRFEELMLNDIYNMDESSKIKLNRDVTSDFVNEIKMYKRQRRNIRMSIKGMTRSGKSLIGLKIGDLIIEDSPNQKFNRDIDKFVCGNQVEYRKNLKDAQFGDFFLVDENFFSTGGLGSNIEQVQLVNANNTIAKKNISVIFITPEKFLHIGATMGLSSFGRDNHNWLSKFLVYNFRDGYPYLIGYVKIDVGSLFRKHGCYVYKEVGGCNNVNRKLSKDIPQQLIDASPCISDKNPSDENTNVCPFFNHCTHGLCKYEKKKDSWIEREMKGGLSEREHERESLSIRFILEFNPEVDFENNVVKVAAKNAKDLKNKVFKRLPRFTNTQFGQMEKEELIERIKTNCDLDELLETLVLLEDDELTSLVFSELDQDNFLLDRYNRKTQNMSQ